MSMNIENILIKDKNITELSNFKTKAIAKYYYELNNRQDIDNVHDIYEFWIKNNLKILFIWWWTNLLFAFDYFEWIVIKNCLEWWKYDKEQKILSSYSGEYISDIALELKEKNNEALWQRFIWLPWSIGWAVFWNAGCFWLETENNFLEAEVLNLNNWKINIFGIDDMKFSYRSSVIKEQEKYFIISVKFDLSKKVEKYSSDVDNIYFREVRQPKWNTCWSFFKNHSREFPAGGMIEKVWLKWHKLWWAFFSNKHANFLMSDWSATYLDLIRLIELAQNKVNEKFEIKLVPEVRIIYN